MSKTPAGFTIGSKIEPGVISKEFQDKLEIFGLTPRPRSITLGDKIIVYIRNLLKKLL